MHRIFPAHFEDEGCPEHLHNTNTIDHTHKNITKNWRSTVVVGFVYAMEKNAFWSFGNAAGKDTIHSQWIVNF